MAIRSERFASVWERGTRLTSTYNDDALLSHSAECVLSTPLLETIDINVFVSQVTEIIFFRVVRGKCILPNDRRHHLSGTISCLLSFLFSTNVLKMSYGVGIRARVTISVHLIEL